MIICFVCLLKNLLNFCHSNFNENKYSLAIFCTSPGGGVNWEGWGKMGSVDCKEIIGPELVSKHMLSQDIFSSCSYTKISAKCRLIFSLILYI